MRLQWLMNMYVNGLSQLIRSLFINNSYDYHDGSKHEEKDFSRSKTYNNDGVHMQEFRKNPWFARTRATHKFTEKGHVRTLTENNDYVPNQNEPDEKKLYALIQI